VFAEENPYIGPTLDRLDETAFVLNDETAGTAATTGTPAAPAAPPAPAATTTTAIGAVARCTLKAVSNKVLVAARKGKARHGMPKPGTVALKVTCGQAGKVKLTGRLVQVIRGQKSKTYKLGPVNGRVRAGRVLTISVKLPAAAVNALAGGARESATFTVTRAAGGRATIRIAMLKATR
jgi:hypothetical protein